MRQMMGGGGSVFGFTVPQGDPGALEQAATGWRNLALALGRQAQAISAGAQTALGAGGWSGTAAGAFTSSSTRLIDAFRTDVEACGQAATALTSLGHALEQTQQIARQALAECERSQTEMINQQTSADQAGVRAQSAQHAADTALHPAAKAAASQAASVAQQAQGAAQAAAGQAQSQLTAAQTRGQQAVSAYEQTAQGLIGQLRAAAGDLRPVTEIDHSWAEPIVTWAGHANDFAGAGAVALVKGYDHTLGIAADRTVVEAQQVFAEMERGIPMNAAMLPLEANPDGLWNAAATAQGLAESPVTKVLTAGLPESTGVLSRVPYLGFVLTGADMYLNRDQGIGKAVVAPVGNLALATGIAEGTSSGVATGITTLAAGDGALATLAGTTLVPGVGEVVIVGVVTVGGTILIDKGVSWVWDHGGEQVASTAWHGVEHAAGWVANEAKPVIDTGEHIVHDLAPWNWG